MGRKFLMEKTKDPIHAPRKAMLLLWLFVLCIPFHSISQNLIMNQSFEDENICTEIKKPCAPEAWMSNSFRGNYYFIDPRYSYTGERFIGLLLSGSSKMENRHFIRSRLLCGLRKGSKYRLELFVRSMQPDIDSIGVLFSPGDPLYNKVGIKGQKPNFLIENGLGSVPYNRGDWVKVSYVYTATGSEDYIVIADFKRTPHLWQSKQDYYFIDEVSLVPMNASEKICPEADAVRKEAYDFNERHSLLEKKIINKIGYPPAIRYLPKTLQQRIDTLTIPEVLFATNSYILNKKALLLLDSFVKDAQTFSIDSIVIEGHTDSRGSPWLNEVLSENRAYAVFNYLQPHFRQAMLIRFWASEKPIADNKTPEGRQKNRRVEIYMYVRE
jgi:outer membrane protein OmpA-like peptidoglycan-associated protein